MADTFSKPDIYSLDKQAQADITEQLPETLERPRRSMLSVLGKTCAGLADGLYSYGDWILRMAMPDTTEGKYLEAWCAIWSIYRKKADFAEGTVSFKGAVGTEIKKGVQVQFKDNVYITTEGVIIGEDGTATATATAIATQAGVKNNLIGEASGFLISPLDYIAGTVTTVKGFSGGTEIEDDESLRHRLLLRLRKPAMGGNYDDWIRWTLEVSGVSRVWVYPHEMGRGSLTIRFMMDNVYEDGFPKEADLQRVYEYLNATNRKPITADIYVAAPIPYPVNITINNLTPDTPEVRNAIRQSLISFFKAEIEPRKWVRKSKLIEVISLATGEDWHNLTLPQNSVKGETAGHLPVLGEVTFTNE